SHEVLAEGAQRPKSLEQHRCLSNSPPQGRVPESCGEWRQTAPTPSAWRNPDRQRVSEPAWRACCSLLRRLGDIPAPPRLPLLTLANLLQRLGLRPRRPARPPYPTFRTEALILRHF